MGSGRKLLRENSGVCRLIKRRRRLGRNKSEATLVESRSLGSRSALTRVEINSPSRRSVRRRAKPRVVQLERKPLLAERQLAVYGKGRKLSKERGRQTRQGERALLPGIRQKSKGAEKGGKREEGAERHRGGENCRKIEREGERGCLGTRCA